MRDIIGQHKTTVDFSKIIAKRQIIFVKLAANLASNIRSFIGTILVSELLHAASNRPQGKRDNFCVFVDEFQNFVTDDFAKFTDKPENEDLIISRYPVFDLLSGHANEEIRSLVDQLIRPMKEMLMIF